MTINSICVCGAGTMGSGIAQVAAQFGLSTTLYELNPDALARAQRSMEGDLDKLVAKGKISADDKKETLRRIQFTSRIQDCRADAFIEAIIERPQAKVDLFNQLAAINDDEAIFASNTSSLSVPAIASGLKNPGRVVGMHFFNPAPLMKLVEVVTTEYTNADVTQTICGLAKAMGKTPVICRDSPGFIVNRVARPY